MLAAAKNYIEACLRIVRSPSAFFESLPASPWQEEALTFAAATSWTISAVLSLVIFVVQYVPIGLYLLDGLTTKQVVMVSPVVLFLALAFFAMTLLIIGGLMLGCLLGLLYAFGAMIYFGLKLLGTATAFSETVNVSFYSGVSLLLSAVYFVVMAAAKYGIVEMGALFMVENVIYYLACACFFVVLVAGVAKRARVSPLRAFLVVLLPVASMVFIGVVFHMKFFPKVVGFIA